MPLAQNLLDVLHRYWDLGFISFGGPGVHVVLLRQRFVEKLHWVDETTFLDLFALGNALPGPGSTQLAFSIAVVCRGVLPGLLAFLLWSLPGAIGMAALGVGVSRIPDVLPGIVLALLSGLNAAAVGLIALAAVQLGTAAATDRITLFLVWLSGSFGICYHAPWMYPVLIVGGGLTTLLWDFRRQMWRKIRPRRQDDAIELNSAPETPAAVNTSQPPSIRQRNASISAPPSVVEAAAPTQRSTSLQVVSTPVAIALIGLFVLLLTVPLATRAGLQNAGRSVDRALDFFANMIIAGTIIFGGGPVVIPLLRDYVVVPGWVSSRDFLLVFAILQAFPGPNFNFSVALGILAVSSNPGLGAVLGFIGIFSPGIILKLALLPLYSSWRDKAVARSVIRGLNATASGLVFVAVWQLFLVGYIYQPATGEEPRQTMSGPLTSDPFWAVIASASYLATRSFKSPPWLSVLGGGVAGLAWYGVQQQRGTGR